MHSPISQAEKQKAGRQRQASSKPRTVLRDTEPGELGKGSVSVSLGKCPVTSQHLHEVERPRKMFIIVKYELIFLN